MMFLLKTTLGTSRVLYRSPELVSNKVLRNFVTCCGSHQKFDNVGEIGNEFRQLVYGA